MSKTFKQSSQQRANLTGSPKLQRQAKEQKKQKWGFISKTFKKITPLERLSRQFAFQWKLKQSQKGHFSIESEQKQQNSLKKTKTFAKNTDQTQTVKLLFSLWESRLDTCLFKSQLSPSIAMSRKLIKKGQVFVNGQKITKPSKLLSKSDFVQIKFLENLPLTSTGKSFEKVLKDQPNNFPFLSYTPKSNLSFKSKEFTKQQLTKNLLQQTLFYQTSGLNHNFFLKNSEFSLQKFMVSKGQQNLDSKTSLRLPMSLPQSFTYKQN